MPDDLCYATVCKKREKGRVVNVIRTLVFGTALLLASMLGRSDISNTVNTSFVERNNGTDRRQNSRKVRKTYCFSKDWDVHNAASYFIGFSYNFCWPVRTLRQKDAEGMWQERTPAMAAGLTDHIWTVEEWITYPVWGRTSGGKMVSRRVMAACKFSAPIPETLHPACTQRRRARASANESERAGNTCLGPTPGWDHISYPLGLYCSGRNHLLHSPKESGA